MNSTGVIFLILAIVALLALMYLCCWWYCTLRRCCGSAKHKKSRNGPAYERANSLPIEKEPYASSNNNNNNAVPYKSSITVPDSKLKYPTAPVVDEVKMMKGPGLVLTENRYTLKGPPTADLKLQNTAPPSPPVDKKLSSGSLLSNATPGYSITQMKERNYQPLVGYDRRPSSSYGPDGSRGPLFNNSTITSTLASRKLSQFSEKSETSVPWYNSEKRSVSPSPYRSTSPFDASSRYSTTSNSDAKYTNIRSIGAGSTNVTTTTTTKVIDVSGEPGEQTMTIRVKADEADKVSSILNNAVRSGELSSAEAVHQSKTVDVKKIMERYEAGKSGGESGGDSVDNSNTIQTTTTTDLKSVGLVSSSDRLPSFVPTITTTKAGDEANVQNIIEQVVSSVEESAPGYTVSKTVIVSSKEEGKVTETKLTTSESSASLKGNHDSS